MQPAAGTHAGCFDGVQLLLAAIIPGVQALLTERPDWQSLQSMLLPRPALLPQVFVPRSPLPQAHHSPAVLAACLQQKASRLLATPID